MALLKRNYELSIWNEKLKEDGTKSETKGAIIGAHDMEFPGRAINVVLKRELKGTNTLTFDMVDGYFDSLKGDYVENELINELFPERKIKLFYQDQWFEFFIKKISEKKILKNYIKSYTCTDAFIDELSRNGYGLTFDEDLYNNVDEIGNFSEEVLDGSLWHYTPKYNWGDFAEFTEEKLYKVPVSQFKKISGYRIDFSLTNNQREVIENKIIKNIYTKEERNTLLTDDAARGLFWDQQNLENPNEEKENSLKAHYVDDIENDGYIYIPYTCLNFCYGSEHGPDEQLKYDRAATEIALKEDNRFVISPQSVDPKTLIQFIAIPKNRKIEVDDQGVILNKECHYFMTLRQWNELIQKNLWYFFEDTRLVDAETLGSKDLMDASISHTFRYLYSAGTEKILDTYRESYGNKVVIYDGYLNDADENTLMGRKYSVADRTEINISEDIDQYVVVYNNSPDEYISENENLYSNDSWVYKQGDNKYRVCSKIDTRQIIPQLARNLVQNGVNIQSTDGWSPMAYLDDNRNNITSGSFELRTMKKENEDIINNSFLYYCSPHKDLAYIWKKDGEKDKYQISEKFYNGKIENNEWVFEKIPEDQYKSIKVEYQKDLKEILRIFANDENKICWKIDDVSFENELISRDFSMVNFGIVGQNKKIEKDKIYCLGIEILIDAAVGQDDFLIQIGKGTLVSSGVYDFSNKIIEIDKEQIFGDLSLINQNFDWDNLYNTTDSIQYQNFEKRYILFRAPETIENPYLTINCKNRYALKTIEFFEAYTKGQDSFEEEEALYYRYSGRDLFGTEQPIEHQGQSWKIKTSKKSIGYQTYSYSYPFKEEDIKKRIIFEDMIMLGSTYEYQKYFIQRLRVLDDSQKCYDTCGVKEFISTEKTNENILPLDAAKYTEDDFIIETNYINLNKCKYYNFQASVKDCDCKYQSENGANKICYYQKFGYCPYRFKTEKHPRRIRTLKVSKSNRFNIIQENSKVFKVYPQFYINHKNTGHVDKNEKCVFYITEKGMENKVGFRYEKNLKDISRQYDSEKIVTKMYVQDVDSELSKTGLCSIKNAEDNISKDSFIIDFSYYFQKGLLNREETEKDLYGSYINKDDSNYGFLRTLGYYNEQYDKITNSIINLQDTSFTELEANLKVNLEGITTIQEQLIKTKKQMEHFKTVGIDTNTSQSYLSYKVKKEEQEAILLQLITDTFYTEGVPEIESKYYKEEYGVREWNAEQNYLNPVEWFNYYIIDYEKMKETWVDQHIYTKGILGQYNKEYKQIQFWKKERASYLKMINKISEDFYKKYEPYLKEGTWSDSNYLSDNAYYYGALQTSAQGAIPKVSYNISVIGLDIFEEYGDIYNFYLADTTWVEDAGMFGINQKTGFPNKLKVLISEISYNLDQPAKDSIKIQNYTTKFEDLFQQISASVQSLQYNENIYKRSSNFTSLQHIETDSLQGTLDKNNLTLLSTSEQNIQLDNEGTRGSDINNHANKYKQNGQGIYFSNDGGQHWNVGIGPSGINADYIKVGTLDASKIRIVDGNYLYFSWDKDGIVAYRDPQGINTTSENIGDIACFNKYGLSIYANDKILLRSGYSFNGENGKRESEREAGNNTGFYLYNNDGYEIFAAEHKNVDDDCRIKVFGEMVISENAFLDDGENMSYEYGDSIGVLKDEGFLLEKKEDWLFSKTMPNWERIEEIGNGVYRVFIEGEILNIDGTVFADGYYPQYVKIYKLTNAILEDKKYETLYIVHDFHDHNYQFQYGYFYSEKVDEDKWKRENMKEYIGFSKAIESRPSYTGYLEKTSFPKKEFEYYTPEGKLHYRIPVNEYLIEDQVGYYLASAFYLSRKVLPISSDDSGFVMYLNNKKGLRGTVSSSNRVFSIVKKNKGQVKNALTVLSDGKVYFGGKVDSTDIYNLPDKIKIDDALISFDILNNSFNISDSLQSKT